MTESWTGFRIALDYTDRDLAICRRIAQRRQRHGAGMALFLAMAGTGFLAASFATALADAAGAVRYGGGATLAALGFAVFWLGCWTPAIWLKLLTRRQAHRRAEAWRGRWDGAVFLACPAGVAVRSSSVRLAVAWSAIATASAEQGYIVLQTTLDGVIAIPARLLQPAQQERLLSRGA